MTTKMKVKIPVDNVPVEKMLFKTFDVLEIAGKRLTKIAREGKKKLTSDGHTVKPTARAKAPKKPKVSEPKISEPEVAHTV